MLPTPAGIKLPRQASETCRRHVPTSRFLSVKTNNASFSTPDTLYIMAQYRKSPRADFLDYNAGDFFVTICTENKRPYFGNIRNGVMNLSDIGSFVESQLDKAASFCNYITVLMYVVMPNHIHLIVSIPDNNPIYNVTESSGQRPPNPNLRINPSERRHVPILTRYVSSLKGAVTRYANSHNLAFKWQPRYHDHYIRNYRDGNNISEYILNNVAKWEEDRFYTEDRDYNL